MPYLVFDVETTGLEPGYHEIIQLGAVLYTDKWERLSTYLSNVYPQFPDRFSIPAAQVHGLTLADLEEAPMVYDMIEDLEDWMLEHVGGPKRERTALRTVSICGQNVTTDVNFLRFAYREAKMEWPYSTRVLDLFVLSNFYFRILRANQIATPKSLSLGAVAEHFGLQRASDTHDALEDAILTAKCVRIILYNGSKFKIKADELEHFDDEEE
ncbi:MAG: 3'-5' exonuclease [Bernardetiaceae bacterium]|nr:3'-5' exonuclease [Bernardetiaceae bacterium]